MLWPAIFRFREYAPIELSYYDYEKQEIKGLRFPSLYAPTQYVITHEKMMPYRYEFMYEKMIKHASVMGVVFVNGYYYMTLYQDHVEGCDLEGKDLVSIAGFYDYSVLGQKKLIPVGFERTFCPAIGSLITPGRIFYDPQIKRIYYKGEWITVPGEIEPQKFTNKSLYKELITKTNKDGIVYTGTSDHIYLD